MYFLELRLQHGCVVTAKKLLPSGKTVSSSIAKSSTDLVASIGQSVGEILRENGGAFSLDYGRRNRDNYLTVVFHFIHKWYLLARAICTAMMPNI